MIPVEKKTRGRNIPIPKLFPSDNKQIVGYFTGNDVEIFDEESIKTLDETCFGLDPKPRQMTMSKRCEMIRKSSEADYNRRVEWREKFGSSGDESNAEMINVNDEAIANPYPIPRSIVLFLEEAFFLHHTLGQLKVLDLDNELMTTQQLWQKFCKLKTNFVECFVSYLYLKSKSWVVKGGIKFGGDFRKLLKFVA